MVSAECSFRFWDEPCEERPAAARLFWVETVSYSAGMATEALLSSIRPGRYVVRAFCTRGEACKTSWEIDIAQAMQALGDIPFTELRQKLRCPQCDARITTTLTSLK